MTHQIFCVSNAVATEVEEATWKKVLSAVKVQWKFSLEWNDCRLLSNYPNAQLGEVEMPAKIVQGLTCAAAAGSN